MRYTVGSLFAGIGGFDLGFTRAGFDVVWQVEINEYCLKVLAKNFPKAERYGDIRECGSHNLKPVDVICGGFPCQDISNAGNRVGIEGERSGLWSEMHRIVCELRPRYVLVENVAALLGRGFGRVLGDLAEIGYDAEWEVISAADMGAPHLRERVWIMGHPNHDGRDGSEDRQSRIEGGHHYQTGTLEMEQFARPGGAWSGDVAYADTKRELQPQGSIPNEWGWISNGSEAMADASGFGCEGSRQSLNPSYSPEGGEGQASDAFHVRVRDFWAVEPNVGRVANGVSHRVDRLEALGNAVIPQIPEMLAERIKQYLEVA